MPYLGLLVGGLIVTITVVGFFMDSGYGGHTANVPSHLSLNVRHGTPDSVKYPAGLQAGRRAGV